MVQRRALRFTLARFRPSPKRRTSRAVSRAQEQAPDPPRSAAATVRTLCDSLDVPVGSAQSVDIVGTVDPRILGLYVPNWTLRRAIRTLAGSSGVTELENTVNQRGIKDNDLHRRSSLAQGRTADREFDVYHVLGAGPVGPKTLRAPAPGRPGCSVALVERELVGGECSYWGCHSEQVHCFVL